MKVSSQAPPHIYHWTFFYNTECRMNINQVTCGIRGNIGDCHLNISNEAIWATPRTEDWVVNPMIRTTRRIDNGHLWIRWYVQHRGLTMDICESSDMNNTEDWQSTLVNQVVWTTRRIGNWTFVNQMVCTTQRIDNGHLWIKCINTEDWQSTFVNQVIWTTRRIGNWTFMNQVIWITRRIGNWTFVNQVIWTTRRIGNWAFVNQVIWTTRRIGNWTFVNQVIWTTRRIGNWTFVNQVIWTAPGTDNWTLWTGSWLPTW